ncbi:MAG: UDP-N-acetylmuramate dehydrogenase [Phycisphaeraceae bacterium]|nr:UDP-N-acetylmuramate dehydrogenase [Phycisphaeraceae bacterium]
MSPSGTAALFADLDVRAETDAPLAAHTWFGIGGRADVLVHPQSEEALATLMRRCHQAGLALRVLGSGANLLVADEGVDGVVVKLDAPCFKRVQANAEGVLGTLRAGAGADLPQLVQDCARRGLEGLSAMAGIPASVGGAVRMNAGGRYGSIGDAVHAVSMLLPDGSRVVFPRREVRFDYRHASLPAGVILWATFTLSEDDPVEVRNRVKEIFAYKKSTQPLADHSAGCMFRNPIAPDGHRVSAGALIDRAGLKGVRVGGAAVSDRHGNFITVSPGTRTIDLEALVRQIRERVLAESGIELETEVVFWRRGEA